MTIGADGGGSSLSDHEDDSSEEEPPEVPPLPADPDMQRWCEDLRLLSRFHRLSIGSKSPEDLAEINWCRTLVGTSPRVAAGLRPSTSRGLSALLSPLPQPSLARMGTFRGTTPPNSEDNLDRTVHLALGSAASGGFSTSGALAGSGSASGGAGDGSGAGDLQELRRTLDRSQTALQRAAGLADPDAAPRRVSFGPPKYDPRFEGLADLAARRLNRMKSQSSVRGMVSSNSIVDMQDRVTRVRGHLSEAGMDMGVVHQLANQLGMCPNDILLVRSVFDDFDTDRSGFICGDEFEAAVLQLMRRQLKHQMIPIEKSKAMCERYLAEHDPEGTGDFDFDFVEFVTWYSQLLTANRLSTDSQRLHKIAEELGVKADYVENLKRCFDAFGDDGGLVDASRFAQVLRKALKVPARQDFPHQRVHHFWTEVDRNRSGSASFEQFLRWWLGCFYDKATCEDFEPFELYYRLIRRTVGNRPSNVAVHAGWKQRRETRMPFD